MLQRCVVLDIEGTTTPISFVTDVLFPYARDNVRMHLEATYDSDDTKEDIKLLRSQVSFKVNYIFGPSEICCALILRALTQSP